MSRVIEAQINQNFAALTCAAFANQIMWIVMQWDKDAFSTSSSGAVLEMPFGGHLELKILPGTVRDMLNIMRLFSRQFSVHAWADLADHVEEQAKKIGVIE